MRNRKVALSGHVYSDERSPAQQLITWLPHSREGCKRKSYTLWSRLDLLVVDQPTWQAFEREGKLNFGLASPNRRRTEVSFKYFKSGWCVYLVKCCHC